MSDINGSPTGRRPGGGRAAQLSPPVFGQQATVRIEPDAVGPGPPAEQGGPASAAVAEPVAPAESMRAEAVVVDDEASAGGVPRAATSAEEASAEEEFP